MPRREPPVTISAPMHTPPPAITAQAELHHQLLLGLELMVATREGPQAVGEWMFRPTFLSRA